MSVEGGPDIVTDGLVLHLDAANNRSFVSGSTTWVDLTKTGITGSFINGPVYTGSNNGAIIFDGVDDYVSFGNIQNITTGNYTVIFYCYIDSTNTSFQTIFSKKGVAAANSGYAAYYNGSTQKLLWSNANGSVAEEYYTNSSIPVNQWIQIATIRDVSASSKGYFYINLDLYPISGSPTGQNVSNSESLTFHRSSNSNTYYFKGRTAFVSFYNRALSAREIRQNYNATKGRYGLF